MAITKVTVKNYLDGDRDLLKSLEDNIVHRDEFSFFKTELSSLIAKFANNSTKENYEAIINLVDKNFLSNSRIAKDAIDSIFKGLGISTQFKNLTTEKSKNRFSKSEEEVRKIYEKFGVDYDIEQKIEEKSEMVRLEKLRNL